jgi:bifunctional non-homologous end joining protein LigD
MKPRITGHSIKAYRAKRNFEITSEPPPNVAKKKKTSLMFVIQKHDASHLHFDFRLEMEGVLKSWAVPKGLPYVKGERRLAMHVEDHPMDYARFEGTIPEGNYGAGTVMVWDIGTYEVLDQDPLAALKAGKMHVMLKGKKLNGEWGMIRMRDESGKDPWLVFKSGEDMKPITQNVENRSVLTSRSLEEITSENDKQWISNREASSKSETPKAKKQPKAPGKKKAPTPAVKFIEPMKCRLLEAPPVGGQWIYELKFDGFRALALKQGDDVQLLSRANKELTSRYPEVVEAVRNLPVVSCLIDGEIVALDSEGRSSFQLLQNSQQNSLPAGSICFYVFDIIQNENDALTELPLSERRKVLEGIVPPQSKGVLRYSDRITGDPV